MPTDWESSEESGTSESPAPEIHLAQYWAIVVKRWRLIALCVVLCLAAAAIISIMAKPAYQAVAVLEISGVGSSPLETNAMGQRAAATESEFLSFANHVSKSLCGARGFNGGFTGFAGRYVIGASGAAPGLACRNGPNTDGASNRGRHSQSTEPSQPTSAPV